MTKCEYINLFISASAYDPEDPESILDLNHLFNRLGIDGYKLVSAMPYKAKNPDGIETIYNLFTFMLEWEG
ncbi:MAG: hypothetical protein HUK20_15560 [Fibrobacter sp.]|nr:hypothetical protein [Fibrobacter sp.]